MKQTVFACVILLLLVVMGCKSSSPKPIASPPASPATAAVQIGSFAITDSSKKPFLTVVDANGQCKVTAPSGDGTLKYGDGKVTISDTKGQIVGIVKRDGEAYKLENATGAKVVKLSRKDGGFRLKDPAGNTLLKIKPRANGFKIDDGAGKGVAKGKIKGNVLVLESEKGERLFEISGTTAIITGIVLAKQLSALQQAALMIAVGKL